MKNHYVENCFLEQVLNNPLNKLHFLNIYEEVGEDFQKFLIEVKKSFINELKDSPIYIKDIFTHVVNNYCDWEYVVNSLISSF